MTELHQRTVSIEAHRFGRAGLSVHAELRDVRRVDMPQYLGVSHPAGVVHHMALDLEIDADLVVTASKAWMGSVPFEHGPVTNGEGCRDIVPSYLKLVGTRIDERYAARVMEMVGGPSGCFHILSLAQCLPLAVLSARESDGADFRRHLRIRAVADDRLRLGMSGALHDEAGSVHVREAELSIWLGVPGFRIVEAAGHVDGAAAPSVARFAEISITKGFTAAALERIAGSEGERELAALVIAVTPVVPQASGALAGLLKLTPDQKLRERAGNPQADSCHMWRRGGPLMGLGT